MKALFFIFLFISLSVSAQEDSIDFYVPNMFMDWDCDMSTDDGFHVYSISEMASYHLDLFNKWGEVVWFSDDVNDYWMPIDDKEKDIPEGVYVWVITFSKMIDSDFDGVLERTEKEIRGHTFYLKR